MTDEQRFQFDLQGFLVADHERRCLLFKYSPGHSAWDRDGYDLADAFQLTERRRRIMQPAHVGGRQPVLDCA